MKILLLLFLTLAGIGNTMSPPATCRSLAKCCLALKDSRQAIFYGRKSYEGALTTCLSKKITVAAQVLHQVYAKLGNYREVYFYQGVYFLPLEKWYLETQQQANAEKTARYGVEKIDVENQQLKTDQHHQTIRISQQRSQLLGGLVAGLAMLSLLLVVFLSRRRLQAALKALQGANHLLQLQHQEITRQKEEISTQALVLEDQNAELVRHQVFQNKVFSIISHDLRAPFISLKALLDLVRDGKVSPEETQSLFGLLSTEMDTHSAMLQNLLEWAKAQLNGTRIALEPVDLQELAAEIRNQALPESDRKAIQVLNQIPAATIILTDRERLSFVLRNLVLNAVKFTFAGGEIKLAVAEEAGGICISVSDNGMGIAPRYRNHLFTNQRFSTLGTEKEKGTGLGLMLCQEFVESLHGKITVQSEPGQGSTFTVWLPTIPVEVLKPPQAVNS